MCRVTVSRFYRDPEVFDALCDRVLPAVAQRPLSTTTRRSEPGAWVRRARRGCYERGTLTALPDAWIDRAFVYDPAPDQGTHAEPYCLRPRYRRHVTWRREDIRTSMPDGPFSVLCCRNLVFTYLDMSLQRECLQRLLDRLRGGC